MSNVCVCGGRLGSTGIGDCVIQFYTTHNYILIPTYDSDGNKNFIDLSNPATLGQTIKTKASATTAMDRRLYPLPYAENITREKTERVTETPPSGNIYNVQDGLRQNSMDFYGANASFAFARELSKFGCTQMSYYSVDINGTLEGVLTDAEPTKLYPMPMMQNTFYQMYQYATDTTIQHLNLSFNLQRNFDETQIYYLTAKDLEYPATDLVGLIPTIASVVSGSITTTGVAVNVFESSNLAIGAPKITGLVIGAFTLTNMSTGLAVPITTVTEAPEGTYTLAYTAVTGTHTFKLEVAAQGYDTASVDYTDPA